MGFAASDGLEIHYECFGAGRPIVLVHGWGSDLQHNWVSTVVKWCTPSAETTERFGGNLQNTIGERDGHKG